MVEVFLKFLRFKIESESAKFFSDTLPSIQSDYNRVMQLIENSLDSYRAEVEISCIVSYYCEEFSRWRALEEM